MGDRGNIKVWTYGGPVFLYSHWGGTELPLVLQTALKRRVRWTDDSYLTRVIFCEMVKGEEAQETGFGISAAIVDNEHPILVVHPGDNAGHGFANAEPSGGYVAFCYEGKGHEEHKIATFEEYIKMDLADGWDSPALQNLIRADR